MNRDALNTFQEDNPPDGFTGHSAAAVLVKRYDDISNEIRAQLQETVSKTENQRQRVDSCDAIVYCNPSLLKGDSLRKLVRENLNDLEDPHEALSQLASYIDKNLRAATDFIIS